MVHSACMHASLQLCPVLCDPMNCSLTCSSVHGILPGKNTGVSCHAHLQGIFRTQRSNLCLLHPLHWQECSLPLVPPGKPWHTVALKKSHGCHHCHHEDSRHPHSPGAVLGYTCLPQGLRRLLGQCVPRSWFSSIHSLLGLYLETLSSLLGVGHGMLMCFLFWPHGC